MSRSARLRRSIRRHLRKLERERARKEQAVIEEMRDGQWQGQLAEFRTFIRNMAAQDFIEDAAPTAAFDADTSRVHAVIKLRVT